MLFDPRPKERREDLYGRERELQELLEALRGECPLILLLGVRRIGKTSLLKVALRESSQPYIYLDLRVLEEEGYSKVVLYRMLSEELSRLQSSWNRLRRWLGSVKGVEIAGVRVELDWGREGVRLSSLLNSLNGWAGEEGVYLTLAFDEAQLLRNMMGGKGRIDFRSLLAYAYDNLPNLKFILTGSEMGLLMDFIGAENPESPLYGRYREEITLEGFDEETSIGFLRAGFLEHGMKPDETTLRGVVERLNGLIGWLTYYGYRAISERRVDEEILKIVLEEAKAMASMELDKIVRRSKNYRLILRAIGEGRHRWIDIKRAVEAWSGRPIANPNLTRALKTLMKLGIVRRMDGMYRIEDPIIREVVRGY